MDIELETFASEEFIKSIVDMMSARFEEKNLHVVTSIDPFSKEITADRKKCMQIMFNFLSNAINYTPNGGRIGINVLPDREGGVKVEVSDTGAGIEAREFDKIFSEYYQIGKANLCSAEGTGLGLALTRRLVELQGGKIGVDSQPGLGVVYKKRMLFCIFCCTNSVRQFILSAWLLKLLIVGTVEVKISLNLARRPTINSATAAMIVVNKAAKTPQ